MTTLLRTWNKPTFSVNMYAWSEAFTHRLAGPQATEAGKMFGSLLMNWHGIAIGLYLCTESKSPNHEGSQASNSDLLEVA